MLCLATSALALAQSPPAAAKTSPAQSDFTARVLADPAAPFGRPVHDRAHHQASNRHHPSRPGARRERGRLSTGVGGDSASADRCSGGCRMKSSASFGTRLDPWRDVYANAKVNDWLEVRAGLFKVPFSLDNLTGIDVARFRLPIGRRTHHRAGPRPGCAGVGSLRWPPLHLLRGRVQGRRRSDDA